MVSDKKIFIAALLSSSFFILLFAGVPDQLNSNFVFALVELITIPMIILQGTILASVAYRLIKKESNNQLQSIASAVLSAGIITSFFFIP